jgi:hypothetical protein
MKPLLEAVAEDLLACDDKKRHSRRRRLNTALAISTNSDDTESCGVGCSNGGL